MKKLLGGTMILLLSLSACGGAQTTTRTQTANGPLPVNPYAQPTTPNNGGAGGTTGAAKIAPPPAVTGLVGQYDAATNSITLTWNPTPTATGYEVYQGGLLVGQPTQASFTYQGATPGATYTFAVAATNAAGKGPAATITITAKATQTISVSGTLPYNAYGTVITAQGGVSGTLGSGLSAAGGTFTIPVNLPQTGQGGATGETLFLIASGGTITGAASTTLPEMRTIVGKITYGQPAALSANINAATTSMFAYAITKAGPFVTGNTAQDQAVFAAWQQARIDTGKPGHIADIVALTTLYIDWALATVPNAFAGITPTQFAAAIISYALNRIANQGWVFVSDLDAQVSTMIPGANPAASLTQAYVQALPATHPAFSFLGAPKPRLVALRAAAAAIIGPNAKLPATPTGLTLKPGNGTITATWNPVAGASYYELQLNGQIVGTVQTSPYTFTGLTNGVTYTIGVAAVNAAGKSAPATAQAAPVALPPAPTGLNASYNQQNGTITLTWNAVAGATGYEVRVNGTLLATGLTNTTYTYQNAVAGTAYTFAVAAINAAGTGPAATTTITPINVPPAPTGLKATIQNNGNVLLTWNPVPNATSYSVNVDYGAQVLTTTTNSVTLTGLSKGVPHVAVVKATVGGTQGAPASVNFTIPLPPPLPAPTGLTAKTLNASTLRITWNAVQGAVSYQVSVNGTIATATTTLYDAGGLTSGITYTISVAAVDANGTVGQKATITAQVAPLITVPPINFVDTNKTVGSPDAILSWTITAPNELATQYGGYIKVQADAGPPVRLANNATSFTFIGLTAGTHTFQVWQCNDAGCGPPATLTEVLPH